MTTLNSTIDRETLKGLAVEFAKQVGTDKGFKGYFPKLANGDNFYAFVEKLGYAAHSIDPYKTRNGYIIEHCGYDTTAPAPRLVTKTRKLEPRPKVAKTAKTANKTLSLSEFSELVRLAKKAGITLTA